ncbi:MAG: 4-hydroxy-tetrahydrodipicolinate reductase [Clostridia bacterium]|nr:4-hydroxy-tetrahydrodipicolinate reductase [Clostridia bacterium]
MVNIILSGISGRMGNKIAELAAERDDVKIAAGVDLRDAPRADGVPVFSSFDELAVSGDVIVDFSNPSALPSILVYMEKTGTPAVLASTGYTPEQEEQIEKTAEKAAVFRSANMSIGVNVLSILAETAAKLLGDEFDIEIVEAHHNRKLDAPSGTAKALAAAIEKGLSFAPEYVYERESRRQPREHKEIGMHAIRGGTIVGEHEIIFAGRDELVTISHSARSRDIFAVGALNAAKFLADKKSGMFSMADMLK